VFNRDFFIDRRTGLYSAAEHVTIAAHSNSSATGRGGKETGELAGEGTHGREILIGDASAVT